MSKRDEFFLACGEKDVPYSIAKVAWNIFEAAIDGRPHLFPAVSRILDSYGLKLAKWKPNNNKSVWLLIDKDDELFYYEQGATL